MRRRQPINRCSFCGKAQTQVQRLIAGPGVYICDECIGLCNEILSSEGLTPGHPSTGGWLRRLLGRWRRTRSAHRRSVQQSHAPTS